jgi:hypothetical protein
MTQSSNLGAVPTGTGGSVRTAFNVADQALATESEGHTAPSPSYPFMLWRDDTDKLLRRRNAANSAWEITLNYGANVDPTVDDDSTDGWVRGALWINIAGNKVFVCSNPAAGAAVWRELGAVAGGTPAFGTIAVAGQPDVVADAAPDTLTLVGSNGVAITTTPGTDTITFAPTYGSSANTVCQGNDARLSDARTPTAHASSHKSGGADAIKLDELAAPTDVTTLNASTTAHGLMPKGDGNAVHFYNGALNQVAPPYDILCGIAGKPSSGEVVLLFVAPRAFRIPANAAGSYLKAGAAATGSSVFSIQKNGTQFLTASVAGAGTTATFSSSQTDLAAGDVLRITAPATADATLADVAITLVATLL